LEVDKDTRVTDKVIQNGPSLHSETGPPLEQSHQFILPVVLSAR